MCGLIPTAGSNPALSAKTESALQVDPARRFFFIYPIEVAPDGPFCGLGAKGSCRDWPTMKKAPGEGALFDRGTSRTLGRNDQRLLSLTMYQLPLLSFQVKVFWVVSLKLFEV